MKTTAAVLHSKVNQPGLEPFGPDSKFLGKDFDCRYANETLGIHGDILCRWPRQNAERELVKDAEGELPWRGMSCERLGWVEMKAETVAQVWDGDGRA